MSKPVRVLYGCDKPGCKSPGIMSHGNNLYCAAHWREQVNKETKDDEPQR